MSNLPFMPGLLEKNVTTELDTFHLNWPACLFKYLCYFHCLFKLLLLFQFCININFVLIFCITLLDELSIFHEIITKTHRG